MSLETLGSSKTRPAYVPKIGALALPDAIQLTPEAIVLMAQRRLEELDGQLQARLDALDSRSDASQHNARQQQVMSAIRDIAQSHEDNQYRFGTLLEREITIDGQTATVQELISEFGMETYLQGEFDRLAGRRADDPTSTGDPLTIARIDDIAERIRLDGQTLGAENEVLMMEVQSLTQQRSQVVTMSTQILNKLFESQNTIARNI